VATGRYDKYDPVSGGFRAKLNAALVSADVGKVQGVSVNTSGKVVIGGAAAADIVGVICAVRAMAANDVIDVMTSGEITDATYSGGGATAAGDRVYAATDGSTSTTNTGKLVGRVIEIGRIVVRAALA
jgi:hypothetical protein